MPKSNTGLEVLIDWRMIGVGRYSRIDLRKRTVGKTLATRDGGATGCTGIVLVSPCMSVLLLSSIALFSGVGVM